jgi:hypothetical protein
MIIDFLGPFVSSNAHLTPANHEQPAPQISGLLTVSAVGYGDDHHRVPLRLFAWIEAAPKNPGRGLIDRLPGRDDWI